MAKRTCQHPDGCNRPWHCRRPWNGQTLGWCRPHYERLRLHDDPGPADIQQRLRGWDPYQRLMAYVDESGGSEACHPWTGARDDQGYGTINIDGHVHKAHRWLVGYLRGKPLGGDERALHSCDNPPCCNRAHLRIDDQSANMIDASVRGRHHMSSRTHCKNGHEYTPQNTYVRPDGGGRGCRECRRTRTQAWKARQKERS